MVSQTHSPSPTSFSHTPRWAGLKLSPYIFTWLRENSNGIHTARLGVRNEKEKNTQSERINKTCE